MTYQTVIETPIGLLSARITSRGILSLDFSHDDLSFVNENKSGKEKSEQIEQLKSELNEYFKGERRTFDLPLDIVGSDFQRTVWKRLLTLRFGERTSYKELADDLGNVRAIRAVASAIANNPILILIPCHRVIGADGKLTGYRGGTKRKQWLLEFERANSPELKDEMLLF